MKVQYPSGSSTCGVTSLSKPISQRTFNLKKDVAPILPVPNVLSLQKHGKGPFRTKCNERFPQLLVKGPEGTISPSLEVLDIQALLEYQSVLWEAPSRLLHHLCSTPQHPFAQLPYL
ncbi:hypothetical protein J6590_043656 [Homalodisca vitripennis]|nr:hypothetical protein J6590_043656 [Homalodisca vitripennis]